MGSVNEWVSLWVKVIPQPMPQTEITYSGFYSGYQVCDSGCVTGWCQCVCVGGCQWVVSMSGCQWMVSV